MKKKYEENSCLINEDELPAANHLSKFLESTTGSTYPINILARRVNLLTKAERKRCDLNWRKAVKLFEKIDEIISHRADLENDPWKIILTNYAK
jgi:hypothetical protein